MDTNQDTINVIPNSSSLCCRSGPHPSFVNLLTPAFVLQEPDIHKDRITDDGVSQVSEFWGLDIRALSALMCGLRSPVPYDHVLGKIRARILDIVPLRVRSGPSVQLEGPNKHEHFHLSSRPSRNFNTNQAIYPLLLLICSQRKDSRTRGADAHIARVSLSHGVGYSRSRRGKRV